MAPGTLSMGVLAGFTVVFFLNGTTSVCVSWESRKHDMARFGDQDHQTERMKHTMLAAREDAQVRAEDPGGIGIAMAGQIDEQMETIAYAPNLRMANCPLVTRLKAEVHAPMKLCDDQDAYALGKKKFEAGQPYREPAYLSLSRGIGASLFFDGKLYCGASNLTSDFGYATTNDTGIPCDRGNSGCIETLASYKALEKRFQQAERQGQQTLLVTIPQDPLNTSFSLASESIEQHDVLAREVVEEAAEAFGAAMANLIPILNPQAVILEGGRSGR